MAVRCGVFTTGQRDSRIAYLVAAPAAAAAEMAVATPVLAPQRQEPSDGAKSGEAYKATKDEPTVFPADTADQLALYERNPQLYSALRNARKGS